MTLIGATTENPYFEVNSALLVALPDLRARAALGRRPGGHRASSGARSSGPSSPTSSSLLIATRAGGDARAALNILELAAQTARAEGAAIAERHVEDAARKRPLVYDKDGDAHYDFTSAFIKSMRGSDPDAALYYLAAMLEGGEDPRFVARRMVIFASEDVGNADPQALLVAVAAAHALEHVGLPEARLNLAQAAIYLARAPKSNAVIKAHRRGASATSASTARSARRSAARRALPRRRKLGHGEGYVYPHDDPRGFEVDHLPEELQGRTYYHPSGKRRGAPAASLRGSRLPSALATSSTASRAVGSRGRGSG